jgi:uncharacterized protein YgiM (DUF1202 family)
MQKSFQLRMSLALVAVTVLACVSMLLATPAVVQAQTSPPATPTLVAPTYATVKTTPTVKLRVRSGPGVNYPIVARVADGERLLAIGRNAASTWLQVVPPSGTVTEGWVAANYVTLSAPIAQLPVVAAAAAATPTDVPVRQPQPTPDAAGLAGRIAIPVFDSSAGRYNIFLVDANGANLRLVVENASAPALSGDGRLLAYRHWRTDDRGIVVANSDGSNALRVTDKLEDTLPSFSPDGTKVAFSSYRESDRRPRLYYAWTDEQNQRAWEWGPGGMFGEGPAWMSDGLIAYHTPRPSDMQEQLRTMRGADGTGQQTHWVTPSMKALSAAPDGSGVAFMAFADGQWDIHTYDFATGATRRLTNDPAEDGLPAWSPDGASIAFASNRSGQWGLWVMDADGTDERLITLLPGSVDGRVQFEPDYLNKGWIEEQIAWGW